MTPHRWLALEGNIGSGKSTFQNKFFERVDSSASWVKVDEPVHVWQRSGMLRASYENPREYGFAAQVHFFTTRIEAFRSAFAAHAAHASGGFFSERSPHSDVFFRETQLRLGLVPANLGPIYTAIWALWQQCVAPFRAPTCVIYLRTLPETCHARMTARARGEEAGVSLAYLQALHEAHDAALMDPAGLLLPDGTRAPVLVLDGSLDFRDDAIFEKMFRDVMKRVDVPRLPADEIYFCHGNLNTDTEIRAYFISCRPERGFRSKATRGTRIAPENP